MVIQQNNCTFEAVFFNIESMTQNEALIHYVWKYKLWDNSSLSTTDGAPIEVIDVGMHNLDAGPDFFNAKIKIDNQLWVGNVEIHALSSDWNKHNHQHDKRYDSVILHVVEQADTAVLNSQKKIIPQCQILIPERVRQKAKFLLDNSPKVACADTLSGMTKPYVRSWMGALAIERLERKTMDIMGHYDRFNQSWEETLFVMLCRNYGFGLNSDAFERLGLSLPWLCLQKHSDNLFQTEALLFGQAGMLNEPILDNAYHVKLCDEYAFLKTKYNLKPLDAYVFKNLRVRPQAFPQLRIAQLAALMCAWPRLFSKIIDMEDMYAVRLLFHVNPSTYWQTHYSFGKASKEKTKFLGDASLDVILINTIAPLLFAYGRQTNQERYADKALQILESLKPERNKIILTFKQYGIVCENAFDTQSLIQLQKEYCDKRKCLYCRFGFDVLSQATT